MKDQFVIAYLADLSMTHTVVSHAAFLAQMLNKGLILLYVEDPRHHNPTVDQATPTLLQIEAAHPNIHPAHVALKGDTREIINALPTMLNGVIAVAGVNPSIRRGSPTHPRQVLRLFGGCKIAYLTVQSPLENPSVYSHIGYGIDFRKESKEKLIWASYFSRFNHSRLTVLHYDYSDDGLRAKWHNNILFMNKFFKGLGVTYDQQSVTGRALFPETQICDTAARIGCGMLISVTTDTRDLDILEWFAGTQEQRIIRNPHRLPILFINPRNDIYVLCD
ncbi:MAG: universal stress protein [Bacteroidales bacterium]|nr:universal stress protein [Bacteroidales bacterium]